MDKRNIYSLERYRKVPLHSMFLYTSEDSELEQYIVNNWKALDSLSGKYCDIHQTFQQLESKEDAYDFFEKLDVLNESKYNSITDLPGLFFWNMNKESEYIPFQAQSKEDIKKRLRYLFHEIRQNPQIETISKVKRDLQKSRKHEKSLFKILLPFLSVFVIILTSLVITSNFVSPIQLGLILLVTIILFVLIGVFAFRYIEIIPDSTFKVIVLKIIDKLSLVNKNVDIENKNEA